MKSNFKNHKILRKIFRLVFIITGSTALILIITNPSVKQLKEFIGSNDGVVRRTENWILFSKYEYSYISQVYSNKYRDLEIYNYVGVLSNFYITKTEKRIIAPKKLGAENYDWILK